MSNTNSSRLNQELLDDFFTEADEHLDKIRRALLSLETSEGEVQNLKNIGELFHHFHSFKGISAIAGLEPAEALAHASEDLLRLIRDGQLRASTKILNILSLATRKLEQIVAAFHKQEALPAYESLLEEIKKECPSEPVSGSVPAPSSGVPAAIADIVEGAKSRGLSMWKFTFSPSQKLNTQEINVNTIREQLSRTGEILKSTPVVKGKGIITFEFLLALAQPPQDGKDWEAKGVAIEALMDPVAPTVTSPGVPAAQEPDHNPFLAPSHVVRVDLKRLDDLLRIVGEMVIHRSRLDIELGRLHAKSGRVDLRGVQEVNRMLGRSLRQMRDDIMRVRLVPIGEIFSRLPFVVRDLSRQMSKKVRLKLEGQDTAIDKYLIEKLKDPLLHMVRNAFSHGIETAAERTALSKPEEATIRLSATAAGDSVIIKVRDDGRGINPGAILERAKKLGLKMPVTMDNENILNILCSPGFSTRDGADRTAGRGVGMSVVQTTINELGGKLTFESEKGKGTEFTLRLPLTVVIAETLLVHAAGQTCAVPQTSVREIFHAQETDIKWVDGIEMISYRGGVLPVTRLAGLFNLKSIDQALWCILVITSERGSVGLLVEKVLGQREVVVRAFRDPLIQVDGVSGATELGDGKPVLILDGVALTSKNVRPAGSLNLI
ncbi:MAG TPA: chemotaxis protein CheA [Candidatus Sulfotelmatobacter sp.]|nr:chemotaxis protein CheA [Candidatus Sulfotelmatobacter sp.]